MYDDVRRLFGVEKTYSMTQPAGCEPVRQVMGDARCGSSRFRRFPIPIRSRAFRAGFLETIEQFRVKQGLAWMHRHSGRRLAAAGY